MRYLLDVQGRHHDWNTILGEALDYSQLTLLDSRVCIDSPRRSLRKGCGCGLLKFAIVCDL